jgi:hypothetical protein
VGVGQVADPSLESKQVSRAGLAVLPQRIAPDSGITIGAGGGASAVAHLSHYLVLLPAQLLKRFRVRLAPAVDRRTLHASLLPSQDAHAP